MFWGGCRAIAEPSLDEWMAASSQTMARYQDITLADPLNGSSFAETGRRVVFWFVVVASDCCLLSGWWCWLLCMGVCLLF